MSADLLRQAAALMRERAEAATAGPWEAVNCEFQPKLGSYSLVHDNKAEVVIDRAGWRDADTPTPNAAHIASWHPAVALAVAEWLDLCAEHHDELPCMVVARAYLGEAS